MWSRLCCVLFSTAALPLALGRQLRTSAAGSGARSAHAAAAAAVGALRRRAAQAQDGTSGVYRLTGMLDEMKVFARTEDAEASERFENERTRLEAAISLTKEGSVDRTVLEQALNFTREERAESRVAIMEMLEYYYTAKGLLGSSSSAPSCHFLACGAHAACKAEAGKRAKCECEPCFEGDGYVCRPVPCTPETVGAALPVRGPLPSGYPFTARQSPGTVGELQLAACGQDRIAVVLRDEGDGDRASVVIGQVKGTEVSWGFRQRLTTTASFGLAIAGLPNGRLVIGFRDGAEKGAGYLMGGHVVSKNPTQVLLAAPRPYAKEQHEQMVLLALSGSRVVCLYANHLVNAATKVHSVFGGAALLEVLSGGPVRVLGKWRFSEGLPVSHISAVALSPASLVVAFRALPLPGTKPGQGSRELSAVWMGMAGTELVVDPHPIALEPERSRMLSRDLALVSQDTFAYSYEAQGTKEMKMAIVRVDPKTHRMAVLGGPTVLGSGATAYIRSVSLPSGSSAPATFTMFQRPKETSMAEVCRVSPQGRIADCRTVAWADQAVRSVSGARLPDGRLALAFADLKGNLLYQLLSAEETGAMR